jgi:hypothetical protein
MWRNVEVWIVWLLICPCDYSSTLNCEIEVKEIDLLLGFLAITLEDPKVVEEIDESIPSGITITKPY